jgi:hypothetical protein
MKKKLIALPLLAMGLLMLPSCVTTQYMVTDNPVGKKTGEARLGLFAKDKDISIEKAAKNGKITTIGTVEVKTTYYIIFPVVKTIVTGE